MSRRMLVRLALALTAIAALSLSALALAPRLTTASPSPRFTTQARMGFAAGDDWEPAVAADRYGHVYLLYKHYDVPGQATCSSCDRHLLL